MDLEREIRRKAADYLALQIDLVDFHNWLIPVAWDRPDPLGRKMLRLLGEWCNRERSEADVRMVLKMMLGHPALRMAG